MPDVYDFELSDTGLSTFLVVCQSYKSMSKLAGARLGKVGLTSESLGVLWACRDYPDTVIPAEISRMIYRENNSVAVLLNGLEKDGHISRIPKRKGQPYTEIKITQKGLQALASGTAILKDVVTKLTSGLSPEEHEQLQRLGRQLRDKALQELHLEVGPHKNSKLPQPPPLNW